MPPTHTTLPVYRPTLAEQETILRWDREDPQVHLFSAHPAVWRKMARLGIEPVRRSTVRGHEVGRFYVFPVTLLRWGLKSQARADSARQRPRPTFGRPQSAVDADSGVAEPGDG